MLRLIEHVLKRNDNRDIKIKSAFLGDGAYDSNENFKYLQKKRIQPAIKVRRNSTVISLKNNSLRNRTEVYSHQIKDLFKWKKKKKKRKYGQRWMMAKETVFSSIKRTYGEYVSAIKNQNMIKEMILKVSLYNMFKRMT